MKLIKIIPLFIIIDLLISLSIDSKFTKSTNRIRLNENGQFIDNYRRILKFHGFNSVEKGFPWYDNQILNITRLQLFKEWGFNIVRLGTMWSGIEPQEGVYNETYIGILKEIVNKLNNFGMYSFLDMHQDVISSKFNSYDGVPLWLINKFPKPIPPYEFPFPLNPSKTYPWAEYYITYAACDAFQNLYKREEAISAWIKFWMKIAKSFSNNTSIFGYELINEPWVGNFYENLELLLPGYAGKENLLPVYDRIVEGIRRIDNDTLIFYEPVTYGAYYPSTGNMGTGFNRVPGGDDQRNRSVLSYHYYCFFLNNIDPSKNYTVWIKEICDGIFLKNVFKSAIKNIKETGGGLFLSEFGICIPDNNSESINTQECDAVLKKTEEYYQSFTYWDSIFFDSNGQILEKVVETFARAYPRAIQGYPIKYSFDKTSGYFELSYRIDLTIEAPTEIFIPLTVHYPRGFINETNQDMTTSFDKINFIFSIFPSKSTKQNDIIIIKIEPFQKCNCLNRSCFNYC